MRPLMLVSLLLALPATVRAQDRSDFYLIQGFTNPALKAGHYMVSFEPHFRNFPFESNGASMFVDPNGTSTSQFAANGHNDQSFDLAANSVYGISDRMTVSVFLGYKPRQSNPDGRSQGSTQSNSFVVISDETLTASDQRLNAGMTLSYRPRPNVELSLIAGYNRIEGSNGVATSQTFDTGGTTFPATSNVSRGQKLSIYDVWLSFVVLSK